MQSQKRTIKQIRFFKLQITFFFHFSSFWPLLTFKPHNFLISFHFKRFKLLIHRHHLKFYKSFLNSNSNRVTYKNFFFGCSGIDLCICLVVCVFWIFFFFFEIFWPSLLWRVVTFSILFFFWYLFVGFSFLFKDFQE